MKNWLHTASADQSDSSLEDIIDPLDFVSDNSSYVQVTDDEDSVSMTGIVTLALRSSEP